MFVLRSLLSAGYVWQTLMIQIFITGRTAVEVVVIIDNNIIYYIYIALYIILYSGSQSWKK